MTTRMSKFQNIRDRSVLVYRIGLVSMLLLIGMISHFTYKNVLDIVIFIPHLLAAFGLFVLLSIFLFTKGIKNRNVKNTLRFSGILTFICWLMMGYQVILNPKNSWQTLLACLIFELMLALSFWSMEKFVYNKFILFALLFASVICFLTVLAGNTYPILFTLGFVSLCIFSALIVISSFVKSTRN
jgi:hypothetical protein